MFLGVRGDMTGLQIHSIKTLEIKTTMGSESLFYSARFTFPCVPLPTPQQ